MRIIIFGAVTVGESVAERLAFEYPSPARGPDVLERTWVQGVGAGDARRPIFI